MKKPDPINKVKNQDEFSSGLMEQYGKWMSGDCFQNTNYPDLHLSEAPFDGMDPQSNGAEIEQTSCLLYTSPSPRDNKASRMPSSA